MAQRYLGHRPALDGVRAIAIVAVMGLHAIDRLFPGGAYGVDTFFVLSAFLITSLILQELDQRDGDYSFVSFYVRRAARLGPALVFWLVLVAAPTAVLIHEAGRIPVGSLASLFYVADFAYPAGVDIGGSYAHAWSLSVEEQFYLVWPAMLVFMGRRFTEHRRWLWLIGAVPAAAGIQVVAGHAIRSNYFLPSGHLVPLAMGCLAAHTFAHRRAAIAERLAASSVTAAGAVAALVVAFCAIDPAVSPARGTVIQLAVALAAAVLIFHACLGDQRSVVVRGLTLAPVIWLGQRSYGLYLYHRTLIGTVQFVFPGLTLRWIGPITVLVSFAVAELSFRLVEAPVRQRARVWLTQRDGRARLGGGDAVLAAAGSSR